MAKRLAERTDLCAALGKNSRAAVADHYSWTRHVEKLWLFELWTMYPLQFPLTSCRTLTVCADALTASVANAPPRASNVPNARTGNARRPGSGFVLIIVISRSELGQWTTDNHYATAL